MIVAFAVAIAVAVAVAVAIARWSYTCFTKTSAFDLALALLASHLSAYKLSTFAIMNPKI